MPADPVRRLSLLRRSIRTLTDASGLPRSSFVADHLFSTQKKDFQVRLRGKIWLLVDPADRLQRLYAIRAYERPFLRFLARVLRPGDRVIDGGAHVGYIALHCGRRVGTAGEVVAVEADPANVKRLECNVQHNAFPVRAVHAAIASSSGTVAFNVVQTPGESGWGSLLSDAPGGPRIQVPAITIDEVARTMSGPVRLIKLDIQGSELDALHGAAQTLATGPIIVLEMVDIWWGPSQTTTLTDLRAFLAERGYVEHRITRFGRLHQGTGQHQSAFVKR